MTGLDKIIARILSDAKAEAGSILEKAQAECRAAAEGYADQADAIRDRIGEAAAEESRQIVERARAAAATARRGILADTRVAMIDETFAAAASELREDKEKYVELLNALLTSALVEAIEAEKQGLARGDEVTPIERFTVAMNAGDRNLYGEQVLEKARRTVRGHTGKDLTGRLSLDADIPMISGGLLLRYGKVEADCSLDALLLLVRREMEPRVAALLFPQESDDGREGG